MRASFARVVLRRVVVCCLVLGTARPALAEDVTAPVLKAAFLYNFTKFAEWPATVLAPAQPLTMCVVGDGGVAAALEKAIRENSAGSHPLVVVALKPEASIAACNVLYVSGSQVERMAPTLARVRDEAVLTVSDATSFAAKGGIAELIVRRNQIRFAINPAAARRAKLRLSSRLLKLAEIVGEDGSAYR